MKTIKQTTSEIENEIKDLIILEIDNYKGSTFEDMFFDLFNADYYIISTYRAKEWLTKRDALNCVEIVTEWEKETFGEIQFSGFTNYEKLTSLTVYAIADTFFNDMLYDFNLERDDEITQKTINKVKNYILELA